MQEVNHLPELNRNVEVNDDGPGLNSDAEFNNGGEQQFEGEFHTQPSTSPKPAYSYLLVTFSRLDPDPPTSPLNGGDDGRWLDALDDDEFTDLPDLAEVSDDEDDEERDDEETEDDEEQDDDNDDDDDEDNNNDDEDDEDDDNDSDEDDNDNDEDDERDDGGAGGGDMDPVDRDLQDLRDAAPAGPGRHSVPPEVNVQVLQGGVRRVFHNVLSGKFSCYSLPRVTYKTLDTCGSAKPCDEDGDFLADDAEPIHVPRNENDWTPFRDRIQFEMIELLYLRNEMPQSQVNKIMELWAASFLQAGSDASAPFANCREMHDIIDSVTQGDVPWTSFQIKYSGDIPDNNAPKWMTDTYEVCARDVNLVVANLLRNSDFNGDFEYVPYKECDAADTRRYCDYMSGQLAWMHAVSPWI